MDGLGVWGTAVAGGPKEIVVRLPEAITVDEVWIDPSAGCGDGPAAALSAFEVGTSADGGAYSTIGAGTFGPALRSCEPGVLGRPPGRRALRSCGRSPTRATQLPRRRRAAGARPPTVGLDGLAVERDRVVFGRGARRDFIRRRRSGPAPAHRHSQRHADAAGGVRLEAQGSGPARAAAALRPLSGARRPRAAAPWRANASGSAPAARAQRRRAPLAPYAAAGHAGAALQVTATARVGAQRGDLQLRAPGSAPVADRSGAAAEPARLVR